ncbi:MAG: insulinase family protein [Fimbriimonadales bacterium]|nr:insulinase family protein [Fimbriimonadales bacterium]
MVWLPWIAAAAMAADGEALGWRDRSGANVQVRSFPGARIACLHLVVGAGAYPETPQRHGWRHLLEHLVALGPERDLDLKLEAVGAGLTADTYRDYAHFRVWGPASEGRTMVAALAELLRPPKIGEALLRRELSVMREEAALREGEPVALAQAWSNAFGLGGLDPFGDEESLARATPADLLGLWSGLFRGANLVLVACVPDRVREWASWIRESVVWPKGDAAPPLPRRTAGPGGRLGSVAFSGGLLAAAVPAMDTDATAQALAAALAVAAKAEGARVVYTPTRAPSLVSVLHERSPNALENARRLLESASQRDLQSAALRATEWLRRQLADPLTAGLWYGVASLHGSSSEPETLLERLSGLNAEGVKRGLRRFEPGEAWFIEGLRP